MLDTGVETGILRNVLSYEDGTRFGREEIAFKIEDNEVTRYKRIESVRLFERIGDILAVQPPVLV